MELTVKNFCPNIKNASDSMRTVYICKLTNKVCPKVDYSSGKPLPSKFFVKNGCQLIKEENEQVVEKKETKKAIEKIIEEPVNEVVEEIKEVVKEPVEEVEKKKTTYNKPKTNNYKKKSNNKKK